MTAYVIRAGKLVERTRAALLSGTGVMSDIAPFVTQEGVEITSRSHLRVYEQERGIRQIGNDWSGPEKPRIWDSVVKRRREI